MYIFVEANCFILRNPGVGNIGVAIGGLGGHAAPEIFKISGHFGLRKRYTKQNAVASLK